MPKNTLNIDVLHQDPDSTLDYTVEWRNLAADVIASSSWSASPSGLTFTSPAFDADSATVFISGGADGTSYVVTNTIQTVAGRNDSKSFTLLVAESDTNQPPPRLPAKVAQVRLKISDTDGEVFTDSQVGQFLQAAGGNVDLAAAEAAEALAFDGARLAKMEKIGDYTIDTRALRENYMQMAKHLREKVETAPAFGAAEVNYGTFSARRIVINRALRRIS